MSVWEGGWEWGWGEAGGWPPLPTRPQRYCDPSSLVLISQPNKVKYCLKVGQLDMAADLAAAAKNTDDLLLVMQSCGPGDAALVEKIRLLRAQLLERNR